jgi:CheY-like chemotaxis protein
VPGMGSTFWAELPLPDAVVVPALDGTAIAAQEPLRGIRALVAEDNPVNMLITVALLEQWGVEVTQAHDGRAAVTAVLEAARGGLPFDVVLMDMHMPQMSGDAAARALREHFDAEQLPIIALTAAALVSERDEALRSGMCDFLTKPIDPDLMRRTLTRHVGRVAAG